MAAKNKSDDLEVLKPVIGNPWRNVYWFARMLINSDKYGGIGKDSRMLAEICAALRQTIEEKSIPKEKKIAVCREVIRKHLETRYARAASLRARVNLFCADLDKKLENVEDVAVFILTAESVMIPINNALVGIPNNDREFTEATAKAYLDELGLEGLATVVNIWDDLGVEGCLNAERAAVVREFTRLRRDIGEMPEVEANMVLTAFIQEFERRLSQKRKGRAGGSLEDVASFLFKYFGIEAAEAPEHFQADIEVDKWVKCKNHWLIGISCKRTLRERWKQVSSADRGILSKYKIKQVWHLVTYDEDLSDDKLGLLGSLGHVFYLRDSSRKLEYARKHVGLDKYVRPMSKFVDDLRAEQNS